MKNCEEYAALLDMYLDGACTQEEAARVREHLAVCEDCRVYVEQILQMKEAFPDAEETEVPDGFAENVMAAVRANAAPRKKTMKSWQKTLVQMAACIALVIVLGPLSDVVTGGDTAGAEAAVMSASYNPSAAASGASVYDRTQQNTGAYHAESSESVDAKTGGAAESASSGEKTLCARRAEVKLTEAQRQEALSGYAGTVSGDGVFVYVLTPAEFDAVLAKIPQDCFIPGGLSDAAGDNCLLTVYPAE